MKENHAQMTRFTRIQTEKTFVSLVLFAIPVCLLAVLPAMGCSGGGNVKVYPVKGRVTFEGKPLVGGGAISFIPKTSQAGKAPGGTINSDGTYVLGTYGESDGSMAGDFRVTIFQQTAQEPQATPDGSAPAPAAAPEVSAADRIPLVYADQQNTPLSATVKPEPNEINFDLKRQ
jgi:hypothetical protein